MDPTDTLSIDPLAVLPAPWLAAIEAYAPTVLAWLLIATVLVHLLVPIARAVERWAVASSVAWDDGPARRFAEIVEWLASALRAVLAFLPRLAIGARVPTTSEPKRAPRRIPPSSNAGLALALVIFAAALSAALSGCGATALQTHVEIAAGFEDSARETGQLVRTYRTDAMRAAARAVHDAGGTVDEAIAAARGKGEEVAPLVEGQRLYALATHAYVDVLWISEHRREGWDLQLVMGALRDLVDAYRHLRRLGAELGVDELADLPDTPRWLDGLIPPQLLARSSAQEGGAR